jgi:phosphoribosylformylglycinamidine synthase
MKFGVVVFPGSNCDRDIHEALVNDLQQESEMLWHKDSDLSQFSKKTVLFYPAVFPMAIICAQALLPVLAR